VPRAGCPSSPRPSPTGGRRFGEVAFLLEPDLKEARGGLRDVHALRALAAAWVADPPGEAVLAPYRVLLDVRGELHRRTSGRGRGEDRLLLQEQTAIADALGYPGADDLGRAVALARAVSEAGRTIAWAWDTTWHRAATTLRPPSRFRGRRPVRRPLGEDVVEHDGEVQLARDADPAGDPVLVLRVASAAARAGLPIGPHALERIARDTPPMPDPWPARGRDTLVELLAAGRPAVAVLETLDQVGMLVRLLPEWAHVRSKPQRNPYHRYTVDRHLVEAATRAAALTRRVDRPDLLLLASLLHDIGKGYPGDHVPAGAEVVAGIGPRIGLVPADADVLVTLVRQHLLLPEVATRRDLDDPATIERVAEAVGTRRVLGLLHALTEADSQATGPTAWNPWKAGLVGDLVRRTDVVLGGEPPPLPPPLTPRQRELLARGDGLAVMTCAAPDAADGVWEVVVTAQNAAGLLAATTGVLALHRLDIRRAAARGVDGRALIEAVVVAPHGEAPDGTRLRADLLATLAGKLDLAGRLARREHAYAGVRRYPDPAPPLVRFDQAAGSTVVEVHAPDGAGVLHRIAEALAAAGVDVRTAIVATLGLDVVDTFYVRDADGAAVLSAARRTAVEQAVLGVLTSEPTP